MSAYDLMDALRDEGITAPPTVYRALKRLVEDGSAHRLESLNAYVACTHDDDHASDVIFAICNACGHTEEIADSTVLEDVLRRAAAEGFTVESTMFEIKGICRNCVTPQ